MCPSYYFIYLLVPVLVETENINIFKYSPTIRAYLFNILSEAIRYINILNKLFS